MAAVKASASTTYNAT